MGSKQCAQVARARNVGGKGGAAEAGSYAGRFDGFHAVQAFRMLVNAA